jgi:3-oxoacyl-[acyl-carrier protein] reductase
MASISLSITQAPILRKPKRWPNAFGQPAPASSFVAAMSPIRILRSRYLTWPVDVLVNNAGVYELVKIAEMSDETFERMVSVNLKGPFLFMREAVNRLRPGGRIINVSSSAIGLKPERYGIYVATKAALEAMTQVLSKEMRGRKISVNAVAPGQTATRLFLDKQSDAEIERMAKMNPYERLGTPEDTAATIAFLCSPEGEWINGQVIRINGGTV